MKYLTDQAPETLSVDSVAENVQQLKGLFPEAFVEGKIDFDILRQLLGSAVDQREERYGLQWHGKREARQLALTSSSGTLRPCPDESVDWDTTRNLMIEGDNLEVLKLLQNSYAGKVRLIYIDPPYNTGKDFVYPDDFHDSLKNYLMRTGQMDSDGRRNSSNAEASGRFHTDWLNMMYPRLKLARNLLREEGVMFVSIDEKEVHNLRAMMDQVFGEENFINTISVKTKESSGASGGGEDHKLKKNVESLLLYCRNMDAFRRTEVFQREFLADVIAEKRSEGKTYEYRQVLAKTGTPEPVASLRDGAGEEIKVFRHVGYEMVSIERAAAAAGMSVDDAYVFFHSRIFRATNAQTSIRTRVHKVLGGHQGLASIEYVPRSGRDKNVKVTKYFHGPSTNLLVWLRDTSVVEDGRVVKLRKIGTLWDDLAWTGIAKEGGVEFRNGKKPVAFIRRMLSMCLADDADAMVLDFFAGSGTTAHAVWEANAAEKRQRRFVLVQLPEPLDDSDKEQRAAAQFCDQLAKPRNLAEITKERLRRSAKKIREENPTFAGDLGFRVFKLASSNIRAWEANRENLAATLHEHVEHLKADRTELDILFELHLRLGLDLATPIEKRTVAGGEEPSRTSLRQTFTPPLRQHSLHALGGGRLLACLSTAIPLEDVEPLALSISTWRKELTSARETQVVFRDSAFADDVVKTRLLAMLQEHGLDNVRSL